MAADEWIVKRVADLDVGDDVRDYGAVRKTVVQQPRTALWFVEDQFAYDELWPAHARVDVRRPQLAVGQVWRWDGDPDNLRTIVIVNDDHVWMKGRHRGREEECIRENRRYFSAHDSRYTYIGTESGQ